MAECKHLRIEKDICYLEFGEMIKPHHSNEIGITRRGESIIADYDEEGNIMGLELVGEDKPCKE